MASVIIPNWLETTTHNHPEKLALAFDDEHWSYAELRQRVHAAAHSLSAALPDPPGRIGILSPNRPGVVLAVHAAVHLGIPFVPLNRRLSPAELAGQIENANITLLITDEPQTPPQTSQPITIIPISAVEQKPPRPPSPCAQREGAGGQGRRDRGVRVNLTAEATLLYTSGTSGRPKAAILTYGNIWFSAVSSALHLGHQSRDVWLAAMPLYHVGGLSILFRGVIGATPVILHDRFDPQRVLDAIDDGATLVSLVPAMLDRLLALRAGKPWPAHLRCVLIGGSAAPPRLIEDAARLGIPVAPTYGLTETASQVATLRPDQALTRPGSSGHPLPLTEMRIMTPEGGAAAGAIGEIEVRGPTVFRGYLASPPRDPDAWFPTGDVGYLDGDGCLYVVDRRDDLIVSGGENIYPAEIERVLLTHPLVADAGVIGIPDQRWGARPIAAVVWRGDPASAASALHRHCAQDLATYKIPDRFHIADDLPRTPSGKLLRRELRAQLASADSSK